MKKRNILLAALASIASLASHAQTWSGSSISTTTTGDCNIGGTLEAGKVGVNLGAGATYDERLTLNGNLGFEPSTGIGAIMRSIRCETDNYLEMYSKHDASGGASLFLHSNNSTYSSVRGAVVLWSSGTGTGSGSGAGDIAFLLQKNPAGAGLTTLLQVNNNGNVGINLGNGTTYDEKLTINGNLGFEPSTGTGAIMRSIRCETDNYVEMYSKHDGNGGSSFFLHSNNSMYPWLAGSAEIRSSAPVGDNNAFDVSQADKNVVFQVNTNGNTTINGIADWATYLNVNHYGQNSTSYIRANAHADGSGLNLLAGSHGSPNADGSHISLFSTTGSSAAGDVFITATGNIKSNGVYFFSDQGATSNLNMIVRNDGKVAIGNDIAWTATQPGDYNLYVSKGILTEKVKVALSTDATNWSDFVFNKDYKLKSLNEVESYVKKNKHLPEIPSATEVAADGIDVAGMDAKLLQKIEELTLYVIQQQKEIDELKKNKN